MKNVKFQYLIGKNSCTQEFNFFPFEFLNKQFQMSIPIITGICVKIKEKKKEKIQKIYVGKELTIQDFTRNPKLYEKYDIELEQLADLAVLGYDRICILNYKKYDTVMVGVEKSELVVPDYFALKKIMYLMEEKLKNISK